MRNLNPIVALSALAFLAAAAAQAGEAPASHTAVVRYADLDVGNGRGAAALYGRIRVAAQGVCRDLDARQLEFQQRYSACVHTAIAKALADVDRKAVTAYAAVRGTFISSSPERAE